MSALGFHSSPYLSPIVGLNGVFSIGLGIAALISPLQFLGAFNMKVKSPEATKIAEDLLTVYAARDIALGFGLSSAAYYGHKAIMGWSMIGVSALAFIDGTVSRRNKPAGQWKHFFFVGTSLGLAAACFGYL